MNRWIIWIIKPFWKPREVSRESGIRPIIDNIPIANLASYDPPWWDEVFRRGRSHIIGTSGTLWTDIADLHSPLPLQISYSALCLSRQTDKRLYQLIAGKVLLSSLCSCHGGAWRTFKNAYVLHKFARKHSFFDSYRHCWKGSADCQRRLSQSDTPSAIFKDDVIQTMHHP